MVFYQVDLILIFPARAINPSVLTSITFFLKIVSYNITQSMDLMLHS